MPSKLSIGVDFGTTNTVVAIARPGETVRTVTFHDDRELSDEVIRLLRARHETRANQLPDTLDPEADDVSAAGIDLTRELIGKERKYIHMLLRDGKITDETRRRIERDLDLEEASLANREYRANPL